MQFPNADPIPIPAPIWLMKVLGNLTLVLHFVAVQMIIGSLFLMIYFNAKGRAKQNSEELSTSFIVARRMPVIMTWVVNLGVPPLLFSQVMYGRLFYSSTVITAATWLSVIAMIMGAYWLLYRSVYNIERGKSAVWTGLGSLLLVIGVGRIYSMIMTLMLKPEVWQEMYAKTDSGLAVPPADPTLAPRWLFIMLGGLVFGGLWALIISNSAHFDAKIKAILRRAGGFSAAIGCVAQLFFGYQVFATQTPEIQTATMAMPLVKYSAFAFLAMAALAGILAAVQGARARTSAVTSSLNFLLAFLGLGGAVIFRDGLRDATLLPKGYDVWNRVEASNWQVIGLFLVLFVAGLGIVGWLLSVMKRATAVDERIQQESGKMVFIPNPQYKGSTIEITPEEVKK